MVQAIVDDLRPVNYKATGTLQRSLELVGRLSRNEFDGLLGAMVQAGLIELEDADYEKDGEVKRYRKVILRDAGRELRAGATVELLISDGLVEEFGGPVEPPRRKTKTRAAVGTATSNQPQSASSHSIATASAPAPPQLTPQAEALAARIKQWRADEAKRLKVPAYVVLHDRTLTALAQVRPRNPRQLLEIDGMGPAKVERFGEAILRLCAQE